MMPIDARIGPAAMTAVALLYGCAPITPVPPDGPFARVSFRVEGTTIQYVYEADATDCYMPTDPTRSQLLSMTYNPHSIHLIGSVAGQRIGMPATGDFAPKSYAETYVRAGLPIVLRFRVTNPNGNNMARQFTFNFTPGKDYEIFTVPSSASGFEIALSEIVMQGGQVKTIPVHGVVRIPLCVG
ncbi:hypothetical protein [Cupriavidus pauculus]|uniref:hypothetical protein n=1 Tax=Cupriavidus pauculus TaxID=82633 RepID=UPI001D0CAA70|nr:hypothetical protein [Cupriavidus pauculus]